MHAAKKKFRCKQVRKIEKRTIDDDVGRFWKM